MYYVSSKKCRGVFQQAVWGDVYWRAAFIRGRRKFLSLAAVTNETTRMASSSSSVEPDEEPDDAVTDEDETEENDTVMYDG